MYFEIHLTTFPFDVARRQQFEQACIEVKTRFTMIELGKGETKMQPMATFISFENYQKVLENIIRLNFHFYKKGFPISRSKIQYPFEYQQFTKELNLTFVYYESHIKVKYEPENLNKLRQLGKTFKAHLSVNSLANHPDQKFLTYRQYKQDSAEFASHIENLEGKLIQHGFQVKKIIREVAIFDSNESVDKGWLE